MYKVWYKNATRLPLVLTLAINLAAMQSMREVWTILLQSRIYMLEDVFEWDERKAESNFAKHGVTFEMACRAFNDVFAVEILDEREKHGEARVNLIGMSEGRLLFVTYAMRGASVRIISARRAEPLERRRYHEGQF